MTPTFLPPETPNAVLALLQLLADPEATKATLAHYTRMRDEALAAAQALGDTQQAHAKLQADRDAFASECATERDRLQAARDVLNQQRVEHDKNVSRHEFEAKKLERDRAELEQSRRQHAAKLDEVDRLKKALG